MIEMPSKNLLEQDNPDFWAHFAKIKNWPNSDAPNTLRIWMATWYEILDETTVRYIKSHSEPAKRRKALEDHCKNNNLSPATEEELSRYLDGHEGDKLRKRGWTIRWEGDQIWLIEPPKSNVDWQQKPLMAEYCDVAISAENALFLEEIGLLPTNALAEYCDILRIQHKRIAETSRSAE